MPRNPPFPPPSLLPFSQGKHHVRLVCVRSLGGFRLLRKSLNPSAAFPIREFVCRSPYSLVNVLTIGDLAMPQHLSGEMHRKRDSSAFSSKTRTQTKTVFILVVLGRREERNSSSHPLLAKAERGYGREG